MKSFLTCSGLFIMFLIPAEAATIVVTNTQDTGTGSLRWAVAKAQKADIVRFDTSLLRNGSAVITLKSSILINKGIFIKGLYTSKDTVYVSGNNSTGIFNIVIPLGMTYPDVDLDSLVFINGKSGRGGAILLDNSATESRLIVRRCMFRNNSSTGAGGAIGTYRASSTGLFKTIITIQSCDFIGNQAKTDGGAIYAYMRSSTSSEPRIEITITKSNFLYNQAGTDGGAIFAFADCVLASNSGKCIFNIEGSTLSRNKASGSGGAIYAFANDSYTSQICLTEFQVKTSTLSENYAISNGGAIYAECGDKCYAKIRISTIADNTALLDGSACYLKSRATQNSLNSLAELEIASSLLAFNGGNANYHNTFYASGYKAVMTTYSYNITDAPKTHFTKIQNYGTGSDIYDAKRTQVKPGSLKMNLQRTYTHIPDSGSIAINTGSPWLSEDAQNGPIKGIRDVGSAESSWCTPEVIKTSAAICEGESYLFGIKKLTKAGVFRDTFIRSSLCDSIVELTLSLNQKQTPDVTITATTGNVIMSGTNVLFFSNVKQGGSTPQIGWYLDGTLMSNGTNWSSSSLKEQSKVFCVLSSSASCISRTNDTSETLLFRVHANNDEPCNAITLPVRNTCEIEQFANYSATNSGSVGKHTCVNTSSSDLWFKFIAPASGKVDIQTFAGTMFDAVMSVYSGTCNALVEIGCVNDDGTNKMPQGQTSGISLGKEYFIRVSRYAGDLGHFGICLTDGQPSMLTDISANEFTLYPNPGKGLFHLNTNFRGNALLTVTDANGRFITSIQLTDVADPVQLNYLTPGAYTLILKDGKEIQHAKLLLLP